MTVRCCKCRGENVQMAVWQNPNTREVFDDFGSWDETDTKYCADCGEGVLLYDDENENDSHRPKEEG